MINALKLAKFLLKFMIFYTTILIGMGSSALSIHTIYDNNNAIDKIKASESNN